MSRVELHVRTVGLATVQDLGRPGLAHLGVALNGAADGYAAQVASTLVGNPPWAPLVEVTGSAFAFTVTAPLLVAVTGAVEELTLDGHHAPAGEPVAVLPGQTVALDAPRRGLRSYVALRGRLDVAPVLGSVAPDGLLGIGRPLRTGGVLGLVTDFAGLDHPYARIPLFRLGAPGAARPDGPVVVDVLPGPEAGEFDADAVSGTAYEVSPQSDHVGLRLLGPTPARTVDREILSRGVPVGAVEVPPAGGLLVLLRGRLLTAGYPVVAVATAASVDRLGQARPGDRIRFRAVDVAQAQASEAVRRRELEALRRRVKAAFAAVGLAVGGATGP